MGTPAQRLENDRATYPAMQVDEILVWKNWLVQHQAEYDRFEYNFRLGQNLDPGDKYPNSIRRAAIMLRSARVDAVGYSGATATIFELKRRLSPPNLGQILAYKALWDAQGIQPANPALALVGADAAPHVLPGAAAAGITVYIVPTNFSFLSPFAARRVAP